MTNRQIIALVVAATLVILSSVGLFVYSVVRTTMSPGSAASGARVAPFEDATGLGAAFEAKLDDEWLGSTRKLTISDDSAELITQREGVARRYTLVRDGSILRRGGASLVAAEPFDLRTLDLSLVPQLIAEVEAQTGGGVRSLVVGRDEEGLLLWRAEPSKEGVDLYFRADGSYVADPDNP
jgi:hypothetical protein